MERRRPQSAETVEFPKPWDDSPCSRAAWEKYRDVLMGDCTAGDRPGEWWIYERDMWPPKHEPRALFEMGELEGNELAHYVTRWREIYETACQMPERSAFELWDAIPPVFVEKWDAER